MQCGLEIVRRVDSGLAILCPTRMKNTTERSAIAALMLLVVALSTPHAQQPPASRALTVLPPTGLPIIPVMEGWYENNDGTVTISFGYHNKSAEGTLVIPFGENNRIEPAPFDGMQPTFFDRGRHTGVFTITLPESMRGESVWWYVKTGENPMYKVPGRAAAEAYQLDRRPRPQGSVPLRVWSDEGGPRSSGPDGIVTERGTPVRTGTPLELTVHAMDPSERDPNDPRFKEPVALRVNWAVHQGPAAVQFARHESTEIPEPDASEIPEPDASLVSREPPPPQDVSLPNGSGTAKVYATFTEPGQYMLRIQGDNWAAPDSSEGDQCCWTNVYQRITVLP